MRPDERRETYRDGTTAGLRLVRRDLAVSLALAAPGSPASFTVQANLDAVTAELDERDGST